MIISLDFLKKAFSWFKLVFLTIALISIVYFAWSTREQIVNLAVNSHLTWIIACLLIWLLLHVLAPYFTAVVLAGFNSKLEYTKAFFIHASYLPAKYLPGGIWHSVGRSHSYYKNGISIRSISAYLLYENIVIASVTLVLGGIIVGIFSADYIFRKFSDFPSNCRIDYFNCFTLAFA